MALTYDRVIDAIKQARVAQQLSQARLSRRLRWVPSKLGKIENGDQELQVRDLLALHEVLGPQVFGPFQIHGGTSADISTDGITTDGPMVLAYGPAQDWREDPSMIENVFINEELNAEQNRMLPPQMDGMFFPLLAAFKMVPGAQVPQACIGRTEQEAKNRLPKSMRWYEGMRRKFKLKKDRLDGIGILPVLGVQDVEQLTKPSFTRFGPIAPKMETRVHGVTMTKPVAKIVVNTTNLKITVIDQPVVVLYPLRLFVLSAPSFKPWDEYTPEDEAEITSKLVFRAAGLLVSRWAQAWMQGQGQVWFAEKAGPFRDVPVPSKLWVWEKAEAKEFEAVVRKIWSGDPDRVKLMKELNARVDGLMSGFAIRGGR